MQLYQLIVLVGAFVLNNGNVNAITIDKSASIKDTKTTIMGINHVGLSVKNLEQALAFYQKATGFELIKRHKVFSNKKADALFAVENIIYEVAVLKAPNMLFELTEFAANKNLKLTDMPVQGPGMTHTCFQSTSNDPAYNRFVDAGTRLISLGDEPIDLGGYGVTYAYGYDPEGNMFEMEQLDGAVLKRSGYDNEWRDLGYTTWMSQVALVTPNIDKLMAFYERVLGFKAYRTAELANKTTIDQITNIANAKMKGGWFKLNSKSKVMEFWQFQNPETKAFVGERKPSDLGYSYSLEVGDIQLEYQRLITLGVDFISKPQKVGEFWQVFARDPDSNIFSLRQVINKDSSYSVKNFAIAD